MNGKDKCELLKSIRRQVAERYGLEYNPAECEHQGDCAGTCPRCDAELKDLLRQLEAKGIRDIELDKEISELIDALPEQPISMEDNQMLEGDTIVPKLPAGVPAVLPPAKKKTFFKECVVAGWCFHDLEDMWDELYVGTPLALVRDRKNKHDLNAVALVLADDYDGDPEDFDFNFIIGYVPKTENEMIAKMMDMGWSDAFTAELTTVKNHGAYADRLRMTIYIQSKDELEEENREKLYAIRLAQEEYAKMQSDLYSQGFVYRQWGGFPLWERQLPKVGDKVLFFAEQSGKKALYLTRVMADNEDKAGYFIDNPDELTQCDDCLPFILTNIIGSIAVPQDELEWFDVNSIKNVPEHPLAEDEELRIMEIINQKTI